MFEHVSRDRLPAIHPFLRYAPYPCVHYNYTTDRRAGGVAVSQPAYCRPQRFLVIVQMAGCAPEGKRNGVLRCDQGTVSKNRDCGANRSTVWQVDGLLDSATHVACGSSLVNLLQKLRDSGCLWIVSTLPCERRCQRHCNCSCDRFRMTVRRHGRSLGLLNHHVQVVGKISAQRSNPHGGAIPKRALASKQRLRFFSPVPSRCLIVANSPCIAGP